MRSLIFKKIFYYFEVMVISSIIWIILNENISWFNIIFGCILGFVSTSLTDKYLLRIEEDYKSLYSFPLFKIIIFAFQLIIQIYKSGFSAIYKIMSGKFSVDIIEIETNTKNDLLICLIANAITLTPGTVTVNKSGNLLTVLWLDPTTRNKKEAGELIKGKFEKILDRS